MKPKIIFCFLLALATKAFSQNDSILKYTYNKENIVASAIDGTWKSYKTENQFSFKKDTTILKLIPPQFYEFLSNKTIYHAGVMWGINYNTEIKDTYFILIEHNGNPCMAIFEEKDGHIIPAGDGGFYLFIAKGTYKEDDRLILAGDHSSDSAEEYIRIE